MTGTLPPAGWYHDGRALRWWDGQVWGPYAPPPMVSVPATDPLLWATLVHLGVFVGGFVGPLVVRLTEGTKDEFVRHHSSEALNGNLTMLLAYLVCYVPGFFASMALRTSWPLFAGLGLAAVVVVPMLAQMVLGAIRASQGRWFRYPVNLRFVRGALPRGEQRPPARRPVATIAPMPMPMYASNGPGAALPSTLQALHAGVADLRRRRRAWATVAVAATALTVLPYFVAVGVNDLVFRYDLWNDVPPNATADRVAVISLIVSALLLFAGLAVGWGWLVAFATDPAANARAALRRGTGAALRRVWYAAPAAAVATIVCATVVGAPFAVAVLATTAFSPVAQHRSRAGWFERVFGRALAIGIVMSVAVVAVYALLAFADIVDAGAAGGIIAVLTSTAVIGTALALVAASLGALHRADTG